MDDSTEKLKARISELENLIEKLRQETGSMESAKTSTPYDDAWRTLTVSTSRLLIPMVNEVFGEHFSEHATVTLAHNEHLFSALDGKTEKRITDTNFSLDEVFGGSSLGDGFDIADGSTRKRYLFECESKPVTGRILVRIVEYAIKAGLEEGTTANRDTIVISIPQAAILSLRSTANTPDALNIVIKTEKGETSSAVRVMKLSDYTASSVMEKKLYLLIPFLLFNYEKQFQQIQEDEEQYKALLREYAEVFRRLDALIPAGGEDASLIDVYTSRALRAMTHTVVNGLARKYPRIKEGVNSVVGGNIILFDAAEA
ncbi:MAG: hypothetical protein IJU01_00090, partial [Lachnospiraceae bacterium]|nr:hypothetical protein [Lachnospiraceae bacterium]